MVGRMVLILPSNETREVDRRGDGEWALLGSVV